MEEYRNKVNTQHAPEELIRRTIQSIHEGEKTTDKSSLVKASSKLYQQKHVKRIAAVTAAAACFAACLIIFMGISGQPRFSYNTVSDTMYRDGSQEMYQEEWTIQEYEAYLGTELITIPEECKPVSSKIYVSRDEEDESILEDEGTFYLEDDGCVVIMKTSKSGLEVPGELLSGSGTDIHGTMVYVGENIQDKQLLAVFWQEDVGYYLICNNMSKRQFEKLLKHMF